MQRPDLSTFTAAHPHDEAAALASYRAALAEWRYAAHPPPQRPIRPVMAMAVGVVVIAALLALAALLGAGTAGCSARDPSDFCEFDCMGPVVPENSKEDCAKWCAEIVAKKRGEKANGGGGEEQGR